MQSLVNEGDALLLQGEFRKAAKKYHAAATQLGQVGEARKSSLVLGVAHMSDAIADYFDDEMSSCLKGIRRSKREFKAANEDVRFQFAWALHLIFRSDLWCSLDQFVYGRTLLNRACRLLKAIALSNPDMLPHCTFWIHWSQLKFRFDYVVDLVADEEIDRADRQARLMSNSVEGLVDMSQGNPTAAALYGSLESISKAAVEIGRGYEAGELMDLEVADKCFMAARSVLESTDRKLKTIEVPGHIQRIIGSTTFFAILVDSTERRIRAQALVFQGDRVASMEVMRESISHLNSAKAEADASKSDLAEWKEELGDELEEANDYLTSISRGDPGVLPLRTTIETLVDKEVMKVCDQDLRELTNSTMLKAWTSVVVLTGNVLEAALCGALGRFRSELKSAPERMDLGSLVDAARAKGLLQASDVQISNTLRDFRNLIHPGKRIREQKGVLEDEAIQAIAALKLLVGSLGSSISRTL